MVIVVDSYYYFLHLFIDSLVKKTIQTHIPIVYFIVYRPLST